MHVSKLSLGLETLKSLVPKVQNVEGKETRGSNSVIFNSSQEMALKALFCSSMSTGLVDIYEVKQSQSHLLVVIEDNRFGFPIYSSEIDNIKSRKWRK